MTGPLTKLLLVVNLGAGARRPLRAAICKLALVMVSSVSIGCAIGSAIWSAALPQDLPALWVVLLVAAAAYGLAGFVLLSIGATTERAVRQTTLSRMIALWPLGPLQRWLIIVLPEVASIGATALLTMPMIVALAHALHLPVAYLGGGLLFGLGSGMGFGLLHITSSIAPKVLLFATSIACFVKLLTWNIEFARRPLAYACTGVLTLVLMIFYSGWWQSYRAAGRAMPGQRQAMPFISLSRELVYGWWFAAKLLRNRRTASSLVFCFLLTLATGCALYLHPAAAGGTGWLLFGALLASTFAADVRGLVRRYKPPEIAVLQGVRFFVASEIQTTSALALVLGLPLFAVVLTTSTVPVPGVLLFYISLQVAGSMLGLLASTVFVPHAGELGAQFFATLMPTAVLSCVLRFGRLGDGSVLRQSGQWLAVSAVCAALLYTIEHLRSKNYGRT